MSTVVTLEEFEEKVSPVRVSFRFGKMFKVLIPETNPEEFSDFFGQYCYRNKGMRGSATQPFALCVGGNVKGDFEKVSELTVLLKLAKTIERREREMGTQVFYLSLPKAFGFSGNQYGYRQVLELFPHLA
tara:strand:- start:3154 stop:3543 length:390 start_codon:yes stop_codon:yes gene_type:complete